MDTRPTAAQRGYTHRWHKARTSYLKSHPLCVMCHRFGKTTPATVVDHITPHKGDQTLFWNQSNWQPLCKNCHDAHKARFERSGKETGCDINGLPLAATHHWRK